MNDIDIPSVAAFLHDHTDQINKCFTYTWRQRGNWADAQKKLPPESRGRKDVLSEEAFQEVRDTWNILRKKTISSE